MENLSAFFRVEKLTAGSPLFQDVLDLHSSNKSTLGAFPKGAFEDAINQKQIIVAIAQGNLLAGYLVYRIAKNRAAIVHLTTSKQFKGKGAARALMEALKQETKYLSGIVAKCRRDYELSDMWSGFGFSVRQTRTGRGRDQVLLDCWWFDHGHADLFSLAAGLNEESAPVPVVIDANVFYDLTTDRPQGEDTRVLEADWLEDSVVLCITREMYNEIHRGADDSRKSKARGAADGFKCLKTDEESIHRLENELKSIFKAAILDRDISDMRQVAHAIAAGVPFMVTRDNPVLSHSEEIFEKYNLRILHPTDLINHLDGLRREAEYRPSGLEGTRWRKRLVTKDDIKQIVSDFKHPHRERLNEFERKVRHYLASPNNWVSWVVFDKAGCFVVYYVHSKGNPEHTEVALIRHSDHSLSTTILRHIIHALNPQPEVGCSRFVSVTEVEISSDVRSALQELGYLNDGGLWQKLSLVGVIKNTELPVLVNNSKFSADIKDRFVKAGWFQESNSLDSVRTEVEHYFSPVKITSPNTPCFIVSIRPDWAAHFFDIPIGGQMLTDLKDELHLGIEGVYYCSENNKHLKAPARILWYVSKGPRGVGSMTIKACSHLDEIICATPKQLFSKFRHLGVFAWRDVFAAAGKELTNKLIAFRFKRTERFAREISMAEISHLKIAQPVNPRLISDEQFAIIYKLGMNLTKK